MRYYLAQYTVFKGVGAGVGGYSRSATLKSSFKDEPY